MNESVIVIDSDDDDQQIQSQQRRRKQQVQQHQRAPVTASLVAAASAIKARTVAAAAAVAMPMPAVRQQPQLPSQQQQQLQNYAGSLQSVKLGGFVPLNCTVTAGPASAAASVRSRRFKETPRGRKSTGGLCVSSALRLGASPPPKPLSPPVKQALLSNGRAVPTAPAPAPGATKPLAPAATYDSVIENENNYIDYTEYFYCRELDPLETVVTPPASGPFVYACCVCSAQLPRGDAAAAHVLEHLVSARLLRASLTAHTRCQHCLRCFATPARMQRHLSRAHADNLDQAALVCRICELHFDTDAQLADHLHATHPPRDMPYRCELCSHRSSRHADVLQHFYSFHACSGELICPFCLKVFRFQSGPGNAPATQSLNSYYVHLRAHLADGSSEPSGGANCPKCRLHFLSRQGLKRHTDSAHIGKCFTVAEVAPGTAGPAAAAAASSRPPNSARSLNAAPASRLCGLAQLKFKVRRQQLCLECHRPMCLPGHYQREHLCPACRYVTCCGDAFARHERRHRIAGVPAAQTAGGSAASAPPALGEVGVGAGAGNPAYALYCQCGLATIDGDAMAKHAAAECRSSSGVGSRSGSAGLRWQPGAAVRVIRRVRHRRTRQLRRRLRQQLERRCNLKASAMDSATCPEVGSGCTAELTVPSGVPVLESVGLAKRVAGV